MKAFSFFAAMFVGTSILLGMMAGGGGMAATQLNGAINATATGNTTVDSTVGFPPSGTLFIGNEQVTFASIVNATTFNVSQRAINGTSAAAHGDNSVVYTEDAGTLNTMFGFNVSGLFDSWGFIAIPVVFIQFFTQTIPYLAQGNISAFFSGGLSILASFWLVFGAGFIYMIIMTFIQARGGR